MKNILIDINSIVHGLVTGTISGIGRTTLELVKALNKIPDIPFDITLYSQNMKGLGGKDLTSNFKTKHFYLPNRKRINQVLSYIPLKELSTGYDLMHIPHNFEYVFAPQKTILTIHDALFFAYPDNFLGHDFARQQYPKLAQQSRAIVTCSHASKSDIVKYMGVKEELVDVVHWGVDHHVFYPQDPVKSAATIALLRIDFPFFLMVSCDIGRKNTVGLIRAFKKFIGNKREHRLVLVWGNMPEYLQNEYSAEIKNGQLVILKNISDQVLAALYNQASVTFFPSKYEGFGLPILESLACGTPVITCRNSSLPEVGGEAAIYVDSDKEEEMTDWMGVFEKGQHSKEDYLVASIHQASQFTWEKAARKYIGFYSKHLGI